MNEQARKGWRAAAFGVIAFAVGRLLAGGTTGGGATALATLVVMLGLAYVIAGIWIIRG